LVVDDNLIILDLTAQTLSSLGHTVYTAADGRAALDLLKPTRHPVNLIISDLNMPKMSGADLYISIHEHHPEIDAIFMSSSLKPDLFSYDSPNRNAIRFLRKPFNREELAATVQDALQRIPLNHR